MWCCFFCKQKTAYEMRISHWSSDVCSSDLVDVDVIADKDGNVLIGGVMEHIEEAGVHSGDSSCSLPPYSLSADTQARLREQVVALAKALDVVGLMNTQFAIQTSEAGEDTIYLLEVNPRASRTVPFVSKATGMPLAKSAARCMAGKTLAEQGATAEIIPDYYSVKEAIFPFAKFQGVDPILGPEMRSTGEVMGVGRTFGAAMARAQEAGDIKTVPDSGKVFISVRDPDKQRSEEHTSELQSLMRISYAVFCLKKKTQ